MIMKQISVLGVTLLAVVASVGCSRQDTPSTATDQNLAAPPPIANSTTAPAATPAGPNPVGTGATPSGVRTLDPQPPAGSTAAEPASERRVISGQSPSARADNTPRYVVKKRSKKKSAAIIGGSAAAGAAIGALAGGGKGAAIGAISGGVAGTVYDRTTAKKKERIE